MRIQASFDAETAIESPKNHKMSEPNNRQVVLEAFRAVLGRDYLACWTRSRGDFSGRDVTVDIFNVPAERQRELLRRLRSARDRAKDLIGSRCIFIFHSPRATREHYRELVAELSDSRG